MFVCLKLFSVFRSTLFKQYHFTYQNLLFLLSFPGKFQKPGSICWLVQYLSVLYSCNLLSFCPCLSMKRLSVFYWNFSLQPWAEFQHRYKLYNSAFQIVVKLRSIVHVRQLFIPFLSMFQNHKGPEMSIGGTGGGGLGSQYYSLRWNNHPINLVSVFTGLYQVEHFIVSAWRCCYTF